MLDETRSVPQQTAELDGQTVSDSGDRSPSVPVPDDTSTIAVVTGQRVQEKRFAPPLPQPLAAPFATAEPPSSAAIESATCPKSPHADVGVAQAQFSPQPRSSLSAQTLEVPHCRLRLASGTALHSKDGILELGEQIACGTLRLLCLPPPPGDEEADVEHRVVMAVLAGSTGSDELCFSFAPGTLVVATRPYMLFPVPKVTGAAAGELASRLRLESQACCALATPDHRFDDCAALLGQHGCRVRFQAQNGAIKAAENVEKAGAVAAALVHMVGDVLDEGVRALGAAAKEALRDEPVTTNVLPFSTTERHTPVTVPPSPPPPAATLAKAHASGQGSLAGVASVPATAPAVAVVVPEEARAVISVARQTSLCAAKVTGKFVDGAAAAIGWAAGALGEQLPESSEQWQADAKAIGRSSLLAGGQVWSAFCSVSGKFWAKSADTTSEVLGDCYGDEVGAAARDTMHAVGNVVEVASIVSRKSGTTILAGRSAQEIAAATGESAPVSQIAIQALHPDDLAVRARFVDDAAPAMRATTDAPEGLFAGFTAH